jgi:hypothetical protein
MSDQIFHRHSLANTYATRILSDRCTSGIFISAPRRTGKSTFIREDLTPKLIEHGVEVIYVDLWSDRAADPGEMISSVIRAHLTLNESKLLQWARKSGLDKVSVAGLQLEMTKVGIGSGETISKGLSMLSDATKVMIVLVIDEAQHAITTQKGADALFALKAARDELNSSRHNGFRLIATGSNSDKLAMLVNGKDQAFFGAPLINLPYLDDDFLEWDRLRFGGIMPSINAMRESFLLSGYRPEYIDQSLDALSFKLDLSEENIDERLIAEIHCKINNDKNNFMRLVNSLPPIQSAVLRVMAEDGENYSPFKALTLERYKLFCSDFSSEDVRVDHSSVQYALDALRDKSLAWKSSRGVYAIEEGQHIVWLKPTLFQRDLSI